MAGQRIAACGPVAAVIALLVTLVSVRAVDAVEAAWSAAALLLAFAPGVWVAPAGWRRRAAEWALVPVAIVFTMIADPFMRQMLAPPVLLLAAWGACWAALERATPRQRWMLAAALGLAARFAVGQGLAGHPVWSSALAITVAALLPWSAARWGGRWLGLHSTAVAVLPLESHPWWAVLLLGLAAALLAVGPARRPRLWLARRWVACTGAVMLALSCVAPWGGLSFGAALPGAGWLAIAALAVALVISWRVPAAMSGVLFFVVAMLSSPALAPPPDKGGTTLTESYSRRVLTVTDDRPYVLDLALSAAAAMPDGVRVGVLHVGEREIPLVAGTHAVEWAALRPFEAPPMKHGLPKITVRRPAEDHGRRFWRVAGRTTWSLPAGVEPVLERDSSLPGDVNLVVPTFGPSRVTAPRSLDFDGWLLATALAALALQLLSGSWRSRWGVAPWVLLTAGALVARMPVEPLRLAAERHGVDLCMAALLLAWLPAFLRWWRRGQRVFAVAALLLPLALATPQLTPPLYGDEPFHLAVMDSLRHDGDLDLGDNVDLDANPYHRLFMVDGELFHSPVLSMLLLSGYALAGRTGALLLLALAAALAVTLVMRRAESLGLQRSRSSLLALVVVITYPLATFSTQIWPEMIGVLAAAAALAVPGSRAAGRWLVTVGAAVAAAVKTRLALVVLPVVAVIWWRRDRRRGALAVGAAAGAALVVGWLSMGHPFGMYRRLADLFPHDPRQALTVLGGLSFDAAGGLVFATPLVVLAVAGAARLWRAGVREAALLCGGAMTVVVLLNSGEWYGGGSPPARYLVPFAPALYLALAQVLGAPRRWRRLLEALLAPAVLAWWTLVSRPHLSINPGDGGSWLADALARRFKVETRVFFPSFLNPDAAAVWLPVAVIAGVALLWLLSRRSPRVFRIVTRSAATLWIVAATSLVAAIHLRTDRVVEIEAPQVHRRAGQAVPPPGTFSRYTYPNGWLLRGGGEVVVPLHLATGAELWLEGRLLGNATDMAAFDVRWDDLPTERVRLRGARRPGRIRLPDPPGPGRHRLSLVFRTRWGGAAILDRVVAECP